MDHSRSSLWSQCAAGTNKACKLLLRALLAACGVCALFWFFVAGTWRWRNDAFWRQFPPSFGCDDGSLLDACQAQNLLWFVALPMVASVTAVALVALSSCHAPSSSAVKGRRSSSLAGRLSSVQLPPQKFWCWWCGWFTGTDAVVVAVWLAINVSWMFAVMGRFQQLLPMFRDLTKMPTWQLEWELIGTSFGSLLFPNFILLFYPISRGSVLLQATGLSWPEGIRYHRWVGHATMVFVTAHSLAFWVIWVIQGTWWHEALSNGPRLSNLFGGISFIGGLALWLTSVDVVKRANYTLFYATHQVGFWAFTLGGIMHYQSQLVYFLPCLLLYAVDGTYRLHQALFAESAKLLHTSVAQEDGQATICSMLIQSQWGIADTGYVWLRVAAAHVAQWHPYEYLAVPTGDGVAMQLYIKAYDRWSQRVVALVAQQGAAVSVKVEGPYAELPPDQQHQHKDAIVIVAGGVGITAALSVLQETAHDATKGHAPPVLIVWSCRHASELQFLAPPVFGLASQLGVELHAHIHFTGAPSALMHDVELLSSDGQHALSAQSTGPARTTPLCPVVAFGHVGTDVTHKVAMYACVFAAGAGGLLLARGLTTVWPLGGAAWSTATGGLLAVTLVAAATLLAGAVVLWVSLIGRLAARRRRSPSKAHGVTEPLLAGHTAAGSTASNSKGVPCKTVGGAASARLIAPCASSAAVLELQLEGERLQRLPVQSGRPDVRSIMAGWLAERAQLPAGDSESPGACDLTVEVYGMGPAALVEATQLLCAELNSTMGSSRQGGRAVHLRFCRKTYQL